LIHEPCKPNFILDFVRHPVLHEKGIIANKLGSKLTNFLIRIVKLSYCLGLTNFQGLLQWRENIIQGKWSDIVNLFDVGIEATSNQRFCFAAQHFSHGVRKTRHIEDLDPAIGSESCLNVLPARNAC